MTARRATLLGGSRRSAGAVREDLHVDVGRLIPILDFATQCTIGAAGAIEDQHHAVGAILARTAERGIGAVVKPHVGLAVLAGNGTAHAPDAKARFGAAAHGEVQICLLYTSDAAD